MNISTADYIHGGTQKDRYTEHDVDWCGCPLCQNSKSEMIYQERGALGISRCSECGLVFTNPRLKNPEQVYWGQTEHYLAEARLIFTGLKKHHRDINYRHDLELIRRTKPTGRFLDVGTNMGFFLRLARDMGYDTLGIEPSASLSALAREYFKLDIMTEFLEKADLPAESADIISMTDVFEHIPNPGTLLIAAKRLLKKDGILFIKVPNVNYSLLKLRLLKMLGRTGSYDIFDSYEHVVHYNFKTLKKMLDQNGFQLINHSIDLPIQLPVWHHYVGHYYQYETPFLLDWKHQSARWIFHVLAVIEFTLRFKQDSIFSANISVIACKNPHS